MHYNPAVETLIEKREKLVSERDKMTEQYNRQIEQLESAIVLIAEGKVWETPLSERYDDENPDYIKQSIEEI